MSDENKSYYDDFAQSNAPERDDSEYECVDCGDVCDDGLCGACQSEYAGSADYGDIQFADPGGNSALRAATFDNPRNLPCPTCEAPNRLTPEDRERGYQCDSCADRTERGMEY